jgi:hypothetical protein
VTDPSLNWRQAFRESDALPGTAVPKDKADRGRRFERILSAMFEEADLQPRLAYRPRGEEIDGSIWFEGRTILIEAKWTNAPHPASSLYQFKGKVDGKLVGTLGLFISVNGFSPDAVDALVAGKELNVVLANGNDIRTLVDSRLSVYEAVKRKLRAAGDSGTPFFPLEITSDVVTPPTRNRVVIVEGQSDVTYLRTAQRLLGATGAVKIVSAGGPSNIPPLVESLLESRDVISIVAVIDADLDGTALYEKMRAFGPRATLAGVDVQVVAIQPDMEIALGLATPDVAFGGRDWLRKPSPELIIQMLQEANLSHRASNNESLRQVLSAIGVQFSP